MFNKKLQLLKYHKLRNKTNIIFNFLILFLLTLTISCSNDDDSFSNEDEIQTDAKKEDLAGIWSIYSVERNGIKSNVPATTEECGRDFFSFQKDGIYKEYLFDNSFCTP